MDFTGKVALVTGGGSGIGKAIAQAFAASGADVLLHDLPGPAEGVAKEIRAAFLSADLSTLEGGRELCRKALEARPAVDILVNNAGFQTVSPVEDFPEETWVAMLHVMLVAPFQLTRALVPGMKEKKWGRILNISSLHGLVASPFKTAYISAKHGILGLTKTVALEVAADNITVNAICPAYVRTPLVEKQIKAQAQTHGIPESEVIERLMLEPAAIKRLIEPSEVADLALYLASSKASSMTGASYLMDLGWTAR